MYIDILWMVINSAAAATLIAIWIYIIAEKVIEYISKKRSDKNG